MCKYFFPLYFNKPQTHFYVILVFSELNNKADMFGIFKTHFKGVKIVDHEQKCCWNSSELFLHSNMWIYPWGEQAEKKEAAWNPNW